MHIRMLYRSGFTLVELMITIAIIAILVTLATPSSFYQQTSAVNYAAKATQQAKIFSSYINDNYAAIYNAAKLSSPQSITAANVSNYTGGVAMVDTYGAVPCATVRYNSTSKKLEMYMYYTGGSEISSSIIASANNYLSGLSGQLIGSNYVGAFGTWSTLATSITSATCGTSSVNGLAINLNLLNTQVGNMQSDLSLHRLADNATLAGTATNYNTMQTDIIMGYGTSPTTYSGIYFTESTAPNTPYLASGASTLLESSASYTSVESDIVAQSATIVAKSFIPESPAAVALPKACSKKIVGKIIADSTVQTGSNTVAYLQCTYDTVNCPTITTPNNYYCYLPVISKSITTTNGSSTSFSCSSGYLDLAVPPIIVPLTPPNSPTIIAGGPIPNCDSWINIGPTTWQITGQDGVGRITSIRGISTWIGGSPNISGCVNGATYTAVATVREATCSSYVYQ